jgi:hypothetical protein
MTTVEKGHDTMVTWTQPNESVPERFIRFTWISRGMHMIDFMPFRTERRAVPESCVNVGCM